MYGYIYKTTNLITNKIYIGQHKHPKFDHNYFGSGKIIRESLQKYGKENFICEIIDTADSLDELNDKEQYWIKYFNSQNPEIGYNIELGGLACEKSESTRQKLREAHLGKKANDKTKQLMSQRRTGAGNSFFGKKHSEQSKKLIGEKSKGRQTFLGKKHSKESIEKMKKAHLGNIPTNSKQVKCINDDKVFSSYAKAAKYYNLSAGAVAYSIKTKKALLHSKLQFIKIQGEELCPNS